MDPYRLRLVAPRIHYFTLVARLGSIRRAAQALNVAPSSVSRMVAQLEEELASPLFERVRQRLQLTSAGELLLYHARTSLNELARACNEIGDLAGARRGSVSIAVIESAARGLIPDAIADFWSRHPAVTVDVKVVGSQQAVNLVGEGECDLAIVFDARPPRSVRRLALASLPLGVLSPPGGRFARAAGVRLSDLAGESLILSDASLMLGVALEESFARAGLAPPSRARTNSIGLMIDLARRGLGLAMQTRLGVEPEIAAGQLGFTPLRDPRLKARELLLMARPAKDMSEAAAQFGHLIERRFERFAEAA
jgi:DNA-binding transcriptional LysR family regulator